MALPNDPTAEFEADEATETSALLPKTQDDKSYGSSSFINSKTSINASSGSGDEGDGEVEEIVSDVERNGNGKKIDGEGIEELRGKMVMVFPALGIGVSALFLILCGGFFFFLLRVGERGIRKGLGVDEIRRIRRKPT